jgi:hypothetical protein
MRETPSRANSRLPRSIRRTRDGVPAEGGEPALTITRQRFPARAATAQGLAAKNPGRAQVAASGAPITNSLAELFALLRFIQPDALQEQAFRNSTPGRPISARRGLSSNCSPPASTSRSRDSANSSTCRL